MEKSDNKKNVLYLVLLATFIVCLWIGWADFEFTKPEISQEEIRDSIRFYIRTSFQIVVQYVIPLSIVGFFLKEVLGKGKT